MMKSLFLLLFAVSALPAFAMGPSGGLTCPAPDTNSTAGKVIINEVSFHSGNSLNDWIELYVNEGTWDLSGWQIILKSSGNNDSSFTLFTASAGNTTLPWNKQNTSGRFMVFAGSTNEPVIQAALADGTLVEGLNLFTNSQLNLHNTLQEILLLDGSGNLVHYFSYGNNSNANFEYDCVIQYPDFADVVFDNGNNDGACTENDGVSSGNQDNDWIAGCNGAATVGESNNQANRPNHYRIVHDSQGFTCEAETVTLKACANESCDELYEQASNITLSPSGWAGGNNISFTGSTTASLNYTTAETISFAKSLASPDGELKCFIGDTETCNFEFKNAGFEFIGATSADKSLEDQTAEIDFNNVNLRAVKDDGSGTCVALLDDGLRGIDLSFDCEDPGICKTSLNHDNIPLTELASTTINLEFIGGIASLSDFNYGDAGRLQLSAQAVIDGVTITSGSAQVDVVPAYLKLAVEPAELNYTGSTDEDNYPAAEDFALILGAYGAENKLLPNYQPGSLTINMVAEAPTAAGSVTGSFSYTQISTTADGEYNYSANYSEVGRIILTVEDSNYLPDAHNPISVIEGEVALTLGDFIPAYFDIVQNTPSLLNTCGTFSYVGQYVPFDQDSTYVVTAKNASGVTTQNYGGNNEMDDNDPNDWWKLTLSNVHISSLDNSGNGGEFFGKMNIANTENYDGSATYTITRPAGSEFDVYATPLVRIPKTTTLLSEFAADFSLFLSNQTLVGVATVADDHKVCYQASYPAGCSALPANNISGTAMRYGRLSLDSTYGPDTEPLMVNIKVEYYDNGQWQVNAADSCTAINFTELSGQLNLEAEGDPDMDITGLIDDVQAAGTGGGFLSFGESNDNNDFLFNVPGSPGELRLSLNPEAADVSWPDYLNFDWDGDGDIDNDDFPSATVTFGQFRGNDKIIQWREVFN